ncbi:MAG TPA: DUF4339 domain-containing protein [Verrucomicrobiota bacterium]|nr:hypothetical protein [Verrucomicrobiales bacterium]HRI11493.1 DUF4339 domain-containing protein [Verrucomicrobiota bacterium]
MYRVKGADQKEYGPVSADQILRWIQENRLNRNSLVQKEGDPAWKSLDQYPEFVTALSATSPAPSGSGSTTPLPVPGSPATAPVYTPVADPQRAAGMVKAPAIALLLIGIVGILLSVAGLFTRSRMTEAFIQFAQNSGAAFPPEVMDQLQAERDRGLGVRDFLNLGMGVILYGVLIVGALSMQRLENWGLALAAAIIAMLPCTCCCLGIPFGIWAAIVLNRREVKSAFR